MQSIDTYYISGQYKDNSAYFEDGFSDFQDLAERLNEIKPELNYWNTHVRLTDGYETTIENYNNLKRIEILETQRDIAWQERAQRMIETGSYY